MAEPSEDAGTPPASPGPAPRILPRTRPETNRVPNARDMEALTKLAAKVRAFSNTGRVSDPMSGPATQKGHRFQRAATPEKHGDEESLSLPAGASPAPIGSLPVPAKRTVRRPARGAPPVSKMAALRKHPFLVWGVVQIFCFGLVTLGFFLGTMENAPAPGKKTTAAPVHPSAQTPARGVAPTAASTTAVDLALETVDLALARKQVGDFAAARALLQPLADQPMAVPGTEYQLAVLALKTGDTGHAKVHLDRSLSRGQQVAPCYYLRAALAGADGDYQTASTQLHLAAQAEPFAGRYFFYWGEALRRNGELPEAVAALHEALARPGTAGERVLYFFKLRLANVGAGRGDPFAAELEERLRDPAPSGDWLLLGAAQNLQRNAFSAAAQFLQRAAGMMPPETFRICVEDFAFQNHAGEPEIAPLLAAPAGAGTGGGNATQIDPALAPPAVADPALWRRQPPPAH